MIGLFIELAIMAIVLAIRLAVLIVVWTVRLLAMLIAAIFAFAESRRTVGTRSGTPPGTRPRRPLERDPARRLCLFGMRVPE